ncbi:MAG TPA: 3D domain-containing protein [Solirubrobacteraceae bacterium]|jgi:3D (Asp-Asp-Asp) domain-containing protein|nr:3D domain-containing protein [Solirubrobacteraceae bacterium]
MKGLFAVAAALATGLTAIAVLAVVASSGGGTGSCLGTAPSSPAGAGTAAWFATAYGPPWGGIQGGGVTATGLDLTAGQPALEVAVDPNVVPLRSYVHVQPNPFGTSGAFYAGDTGGAILGRHVDIYDWRGRASQDAWGARHVSVTPAPNPGAGNLLGGVSPAPRLGGIETGGCPAALPDGAIGLTAGQTARILPSGSAAAPRESPAVVRRAVAAGNLIHTRPYPEPVDVHYGSLATLWPAYDCSGATSFVLYAAGLMGPSALDSTGLETYGLPGPGRWITIYANSAHAWIVVAGIALDTAGYGGPAIPPGSGPRWRSAPLANLGDGATYVVRHPSGL